MPSRTPADHGQSGRGFAAIDPGTLPGPDSARALTVEVRDSLGVAIDTAAVAWEVHDTTIAGVDSAGTLFARRPFGQYQGFRFERGAGRHLGGGRWPDPDLPPNIILILTDDQDGASFSGMEAVQRLLAAEGTVFPNFFVSEPSVLPVSREHAHRPVSPQPRRDLQRRSVRRNQWLPEGTDGESNSLPLWMQAEGYRTGLIGQETERVLHGSTPDDVPVGWDRWVSANADLGYRINVDGTIVHMTAAERTIRRDVLSDHAIFA